MTRILLCAAAALAFAVSLPALNNRAAAQEADAGAEATTDSSQSADASADASGSADTQSSSSEADTQASSSSDNSASQSSSADSGSAQSSSSESASSDTSSDNSQSSQSDSPALPPPSAQTDANADADVNANANADANADVNANQDQDQPSADADAQTDAAARNRVDGQAGARNQTRDGNAQGRRGPQDFRRGIRFGRATNRGLTINFIQQNSVFYDSGLRQGDILISLRGRPIRSEADFIRFMAYHPGDRVPVIILRDGRQETIYIEYPQEVVHADQPHDQVVGHAYLGVNFDGQVRDAAIVRDVTPGSPAEQAGLQPGDMIVALNGEEVRNHQDAIAIIRSMRPGDRLGIAFARRVENETEAVLTGRQGDVRTATYDPEVTVERRPLPPRNNGRVEVEVDTDSDRRALDRDRDRNRDDNRNENRSLLRRVLD